MMTKRKTSLLALGATATLMALAPTAVNADAYSNTAHSCEYLNNLKACSLLGTEATCGADTSCLWTTEDGDSFCGTPATVISNYEASIKLPEGNAEMAAGTALYAGCTGKSTEADCTGSCEWHTISNSCGVSEAALKETLSNEISAMGLYRQLKCSEVTVEGDCTGTECEWNGTAGECEGKEYAVEVFIDICKTVSPASRLTKVSAVVSAVFVAALASLA